MDFKFENDGWFILINCVSHATRLLYIESYYFLPQINLKICNVKLQSNQFFF